MSISIKPQTAPSLALCALFLSQPANAVLVCEDLFPKENLAAMEPEFTGDDPAAIVASTIRREEAYDELIKKTSCSSTDKDLIALGKLRGIWKDIRSIKLIKEHYIGSNGSGGGVGDALLGLRVKNKQFVTYTVDGVSRKYEYDGYFSPVRIANAILAAHTSKVEPSADNPGTIEKAEYDRLKRAVVSVEFAAQATLTCKATRVIEECKQAEKALLESRDKGEFESTSDYKLRKQIFPLNEQKAREEFTAKAAAITADVTDLFAPQIQSARSELQQFLDAMRLGSAPLTLSKYDADRETFNAKLVFGEEEREFVLEIPRNEAPLAKQTGLTADIGYKLKADKDSFSHVIVFISVTGPNRRLVYNWGQAAISIARTTAQQSSVPNLRLALNDNSAIAIDANGAESSISVAITNSSGTAYGAYLEISAGTVIRTPKIVFVGDLPSNSSRNVTIPIAAPNFSGASIEKVSIRLKEARGYDSNEMIVKIPLKAPGKPRLVIESASFQDASKDGVLSPGEMVVITFKIKNAGDGAAKKASFDVSNDNPNIIFQGSKQQDISLLAAGQTRSLQFTLMPNMSFTGNGLDLLGSLTSADTSEKYPLRIPISESGRNTIEYSLAPARNQDDLSLSNHRQRAFDQDSFAVVLGVQDYKKVGPVSFAQNDARKFREFAHKLMGIPNDAAHMYFMDSGVTLGELKKVFGKNTGWLAKRTRATSRVVIFYAGHGAPDLERRSAYLIPEDGDPNYPRETGISLSEIGDVLNTLPAKSITVFIDACFSGNDRESKSLLANARPLRITADQTIATKANIAILTAASSDQISSSDPTQGHGLFTYFLLKELSKATSLSIPIGDLADLVRDGVKKRAAELDREQEPQLMGNRDIAVAP